MRNRVRKLGGWLLLALAVVAFLFVLYASVFFFPYPLFPNHAEFAGFSVYSDDEISEDIELVLDDARRRIEAMELYRGATTPRIFVCHSQRLFIFLNRLAGKRHVGQALVISVAGNVFLSETGIESVAQRNGGRPVHSRLEGSWSAAIAHEVAHDQVFAELGFRKARSIPVWKSEGYADYEANLASAASDSDYEFRSRIGLLLDDDNWRSPVKFFDRHHFRWHVLVEYLCTVRGFDFADLMDEEVTEESTWNDVMAWYSALPEG